MTKSAIPALAALVIAASWATAASAGIFPTVNEDGTPTLAPLIEGASPSVVNISTLGTVERRGPFSPFSNDPRLRRNIPPQQFNAAGSGVIVDAGEGYIITNNHVVENADEITVTLYDERTLQAKVIGTDPGSDIAVLQVDADDLTQIPLADSDRAKVGDFVVAIGNPFGLQHTVTSGIISGLGRYGISADGYEDFIQTDASINPGNSGGALINLNGELVGINSVILSGSGGNIGIGFAIPSNMVRNVMAQLIEFGEVRRGLLGVQIQRLTPAIAKAMDKDNTLGALVVVVSEDSAAEKAGIEAGDVIVEVDGETINDSIELRNIIGNKPIGEDVQVKVWRNGTVEERVATLGQQVQSSTLSGGTIHPGLDGADLASADPTALVQGVAVTAVAPDSPAAQRGLRQNDIITEVNKTDVTTVGELRDAAEGDEVLLLSVRRGNNRLLIPIQ